MRPFEPTWVLEVAETLALASVVFLQLILLPLLADGVICRLLVSFSRAKCVHLPEAPAPNAFVFQRAPESQWTPSGGGPTKAGAELGATRWRLGGARVRVVRAHMCATGGGWPAGL